MITKAAKDIVFAIFRDLVFPHTVILHFPPLDLGSLLLTLWHLLLPHGGNRVGSYDPIRMGKCDIGPRSLKNSSILQTLLPELHTESFPKRCRFQRR